MIQAAFFDLDDTLCDAAPAFHAGRRAAFAAALAAKPGLTEAALNDAWTRTHAELLPLLEAGALTTAEARDTRFRRTLVAAGAPDDALADQLNDLLGATQLERLRRFDDVAALDELRERGIYVGVITNGADDEQADSQRTKARLLGLLDEVNGCWISDAMGYRKPDPRAFAPALAAAGRSAADCMYVGDSLAADVAGANAAGLRSVLLTRGASAAPAEGQPQPWRVVRSLWETLDLLSAE